MHKPLLWAAVLAALSAVSSPWLLGAAPEHRVFGALFLLAGIAWLLAAAAIILWQRERASDPSAPSHVVGPSRAQLVVMGLAGLFGILLGAAGLWGIELLR